MIALVSLGGCSALPGAAASPARSAGAGSAAAQAVANSAFAVWTRTQGVLPVDSATSAGSAGTGATPAAPGAGAAASGLPNWVTGWVSAWQKQDFAAMARAEGAIDDRAYASRYQALWAELRSVAAGSGLSPDLALPPRAGNPTTWRGGAQVPVSLGHLGVVVDVGAAGRGWRVSGVQIQPATVRFEQQQQQAAQTWNDDLAGALGAYQGLVRGLDGLPLSTDPSAALDFLQLAEDLQRRTSVLTAAEPGGLTTVAVACAAQLQTNAAALVHIGQSHLAAATAGPSSTSAITTPATPPIDAATQALVASFAPLDAQLLQACATLLQ